MRNLRGCCRHWRHVCNHTRTPGAFLEFWCDCRHWRHVCNHTRTLGRLLLLLGQTISCKAKNPLKHGTLKFQLRSSRNHGSETSEEPSRPEQNMKAECVILNHASKLVKKHAKKRKPLHRQHRMPL